MNKIEFLKDVKREIAFDIIEYAQKEGTTKFKVDELLPVMATPCTHIDFDLAEKENWQLTSLMRSARHFVKNWRHIEAYDKPALSHLLSTDWLPKLDDVVKYSMLKEDKLIADIADDGTVTLNEKLFNAYKSIYDKGDFKRLDYTSDIDFMGAKIYRVPGHESHEEFQLKKVDSVYSVDGLKISEDDWYKVVKASSDNVKEYLAVVLQMPKSFSCYDVERKFDMTDDTANMRNTTLGQTVSIMLNIDVASDKDATKDCFWCIPMEGGYQEKGGHFKWHARPELIAAARKVLEEEHFPMPKAKTK